MKYKTSRALWKTIITYTQLLILCTWWLTSFSKKFTSILHISWISIWTGEWMEQSALGLNISPIPQKGSTSRITIRPTYGRFFPHAVWVSTVFIFFSMAGWWTRWPYFITYQTAWPNLSPCKFRPFCQVRSGLFVTIFLHTIQIVSTRSFKACLFKWEFHWLRGGAIWRDYSE